MKKTIILAMMALTLPLSVKAELNTIKLEKDTDSGYKDIRCISGKDYCYLLRDNKSQANTKDLSTIDKTGKLLGTISFSNDYDVELDNATIYITTKQGAMIDKVDAKSLKKVNVPVSTLPKTNLVFLFNQPRKPETNVNYDQVNRIRNYLINNIDVLKTHRDYLGPTYIKLNDTYYATFINKETKEANIAIIDNELKNHKLLKVDYTTFNSDTHIVDIFLNSVDDKIAVTYRTQDKCTRTSCNTHLYFQSYVEEKVKEEKPEEPKKPETEDKKEEHKENKKEDKKDKEEDPRKGFAITLTIGGVLLALAVIAYIVDKRQ